MEKSSSSPGVRRKFVSVRRKKRSHDELEKRKEEEKEEKEEKEEGQTTTPTTTSPRTTTTSPSPSFPPEKTKGSLFLKTSSENFTHFFRRKTVSGTNRDEAILLKEEKKRARHRNRSEKFQTTIRPTVENDNFSTQSCHFYSVSCEDVAESLPSKGVLVKGIGDLPPDVHDSLRRMKVDDDVLEEHFEILLNILSFADKHIPRRRFITKKQLRVLKQQKEKNLPNVSDRILLSPSEAYETVPFAEARGRFKWDKYMGSGGFGQVVAAKCRDKRSELYGAKVALKFQGNCSAKEGRFNLDEVSLLKFCEHPNIVRIHQALDVGLEVWLIIELVKGGNLNRVATNKSSPFTEPEIAHVGREILLGLEYLHENMIAHRDLKNLNIMLSITGEVKIIDFGLAIDISLGKRVQMVGSPYWMAPEMVRGEPHSLGVDVWAFVVSMLELANQRPSNVGNVKRAMFLVGTVGLTRRFGKGRVWSHEFQDFIDQGATFDPAERPSAKDLLKHKFLKKACTAQALKRKLEPIFFVDAFNGTGMGQIH